MLRCGWAELNIEMRFCVQDHSILVLVDVRRENSFNICLGANVLEGLRSADTCCLNFREFWNIGYQICSSAAGKLSQSVTMRGVEIEFGIDRLVLIKFKAAQLLKLLQY